MLSVTSPLDQRLLAMGKEICAVRMSGEWDSLPERTRMLIYSIEMTLYDAVAEVAELQRKPSRREMEAAHDL